LIKTKHGHDFKGLKFKINDVDFKVPDHSKTVELTLFPEHKKH